MKPVDIKSIAGTLAEVQKAITDTSVVNGALVREDLQAGLAIAGPRDTPLRNRLNRIEGNGNAHAYYMMKPNADTTKGVFYGTTPGNGVFPKGGLPTDSFEAYDYIATPYANLGDIARVTFQDQAQGRSYTDIRAQRLKVKTANAAMIEEYFIINGDSSVGQTGGGFIFDGLIKQIQSRGGQILIPSNGQMSLGLIAQLALNIWTAGGQGDTLVLDGLSKGILTAQARQVMQLFQTTGNTPFAGGGMTGGIMINAWDFGYGETDWVVDRYLVPNAYDRTHYAMLLDVKSADQMNDGNVVQMVDVDPMHAIDLAITDTSWKTLVYETTSLMISVPQFQGLIEGVTFAGQTIQAPGTANLNS